MGAVSENHAGDGRGYRLAPCLNLRANTNVAPKRSAFFEPSTAEGTGTTVGAQLGVRYKSDKFIIAAAYTTRTNTKVEGSLKDIHPAATTLVAGDAKVDFRLPDRLQAGIAVPLRPNLWWEFDLDWIGWSYVDELTIIQSNGTVANAGRNTFDNDDTLSV
ncbi:MAG: hypothetical protein V3T19_07155, partial [Acidiferrobacterales bacterium]